MVKMFVEEDRYTVVFPKTDKARGIIQRILNEAYGEEEDFAEIPIQGLLPTNSPTDDLGISIIEKERKFVRKDVIRKDPRNPYVGLNVYEALKEHGISAFGHIFSVGNFGKDAEDMQIIREGYADLKKYLSDINTDDYFLKADSETISETLRLLSRIKRYRKHIENILSYTATLDVDAFIKEASESQIRSCLKKVINDIL